MDASNYILLSTTALVAALIAVLAFAVLRVGAAARGASRQRAGGAETAFMAAALEEAVAKLRRQEQAMKARAEASERLSSEIIASMTSGLIVVGRDEVVRTVNPAGCRMLAIEGDPAGRSYRTVLAPTPPLVGVIDEALATGRPIVRRTLDLRQAGTAADPTHLGVTASPIVGEGDQPHGVICLFTDLTAVADLEDQLRLRESLSTLGEMTAGIAHEFRNGLATIHGYARLIDPERLPADYRPYITSIRQETQSLGEIVTNFLNFARPAQLTIVDVDLALLAHRAADEVRAEIEAKGGTIRVEGRLPVIEGDEVLLRQALSNLVRNAQEACGEHGVVPHMVIAGSVDEGSGYVRVTVTDNGPGIDPAVRSRLFRPFFTTKPSGTGLGLAFVQKIAVIHGGRVAVLDGGPGASLQLTLPPRQDRGDEDRK